MPKNSAGILLYRFRESSLEVFLVHMGGPFWKNKDERAWSIPKGEFTDDESAFTAAKREFEEETGQAVEGEFIPLEPVKQSGGKKVWAWAVKGEADPGQLKSNTFKIEWPPNSGNLMEFPEVDRAAWFTVHEAENKIIKAQAGLIKQLVHAVRTGEKR